MTAPVRTDLYARAKTRASANPDEAIALGLVVITGMERLTDHERFTGPGLSQTYATEFLMPDGVAWELTLRRKS